MSTATTSSTITVNAFGMSGDKLPPHFKLLVDGQAVGEASAASESTRPYSFTADLAANKPHSIQIVYDNDAVNGSSRDLYVQSIEVNGHVLKAADATYTRDDGGAVGAAEAGRQNMWWDGALKFDTPADFYAGKGAAAPAGTPTAAPAAPAAGTDATIVVNAQGTAAAGQNAHFNLLVDGHKVGEGTVGEEAKDFTFTAKVDGAAHKVQIQYDNDAVAGWEDRNLQINGISVNGHHISPTDDAVSVHRDDSGADVGATGSLYWDATLTTQVGASHFTAPAGSTGGSEPAKPGNQPADGGSGSTGGSTGGSAGGSTGGSTGGGSNLSASSVSVGNVTVTDPGMVESSGAIKGFLHTEGNQIVDEAGQNVRLTGVNWFGGEGYNYVPAGLWSDSYQHHLENMKEVGFNTIRLTWSDEMFDSSAVTNGIDYSKNPDLAGLTRLQVYDKVIDYAGKIGMKVILDHHRNDGGAGTNEHGLWYTDAHPESKMIENWKMLAKHYAGNETVIGADLHNEPSVSATWGDGNAATDWAAAAERIGNAIQSVNKDWLMLVEGTEWSSTLAGAKDHPVEFDVPNKLVYSPHAYGQSVGQFSWLNDPNYPNNLPAQYDKMWGYLYKNDTAPILLGEWGGQFKTEAEQTWGKAMVKYLNGDWNLDGKSDIPAGDQGMSSTFWAWTPESGDVGGVLMPDYKTVDPTKLSIIKGALAAGTDSATTVAGSEEAIFTVRLAKALTTATTIDYATEDGTAKAGSDYTAASGSLTFQPGETSKTISVHVTGDHATEGSENFLLHLSNGNALLGTATGTILDHAA
ncbi:cellulase family glycosylhydrolase [Azospirillum picis]|uniref:cellulase n=1 Tax=Azospirillum picis TaxID=488438 RepID=A0ABU0MQQ5_9PROT|nr:carbohydrate-binding domain-containing protein [Azospirillum picis]MBP2302223.1 endoglucanase [Azospirillum picis]MDQ0535802.1 endoglucanase [Azospirillum picis]